jgi:hypothetical protein
MFKRFGLLCTALPRPKPLTPAEVQRGVGFTLWQSLDNEAKQCKQPRQKVVKQTPQVKNKKMCFENIFRMNNFSFQKFLKILQKKKMHDKI